MHSSIFLVVCHYSYTFSIFHDEISGKVLDEELGVVTKRLSIKSVQHGMSSAIGGGGTSVSLSSLTKFERLSTESTLVDLSFLGTGEGKSVML
jgi:hypothetical protein